MSLETRHQFANLPDALRETLEKGWSEWDEVIRRTRWGEVPIHMVGSGTSFCAGLAGAYAFESLLGWPVVVRTPGEFQAYSLQALRPRSILLVISWAGSAEWLELVRDAKARGATVLALTHSAQSPLAKVVNGVLLAHGGEERRDDFTAALCQLTAVHCLALVAARVLRRSSPQTEMLEGEFRTLPEHIKWVLTQLLDAVQSLAAELSRQAALSIVAAGPYYPAALLAASALRSVCKLHVQVFTCDEMQACRTEALDAAELLLAISGSRCRVKRPLHELIERLHHTGMKVLAVTDHNEPELTRRAALAILLPNLSELVGSIVALAFLDWTGYHVAPQRSGREAPPRGT